MLNPYNSTPKQLKQAINNPQHCREPFYPSFYSRRLSKRNPLQSCVLFSCVEELISLSLYSLLFVINHDAVVKPEPPHHSQ